MIDEKKLVEDIKRRCYIPKEMAEIFETIVDEQPKVGEWIPCSERMPEKEGRYITTSYSTYKRDIGLECFDLWYEDGQWYVDSDDYLYEGEVIAWMPLPEPYREEGDSDEKN